jgi:hypothetical protein
MAGVSRPVGADESAIVGAGEKDSRLVNPQRSNANDREG